MSRLLLLALLGPLACTVDRLVPEGRPCGGDLSGACGPGTVCSPTTKRCEVQASDLGGDLKPREGSPFDLRGGERRDGPSERDRRVKDLPPKDLTAKKDLPPKQDLVAKKDLPLAPSKDLVVKPDTAKKDLPSKDLFMKQDTAKKDLPSMDVATSLSKRVFVTSQLYGCNLGGLVGADAKCQTRAQAAGLSGVYRAWLSDSTTTAGSRLAHSSSPYRLVNGTMVASGWTDLTDGTLLAPIDKTETGGVPPTASYTPCGYDTIVWSSTAASGGYPAASWTGNPTFFGNDWQGSGGASVGRWGQVSSTWSHNCQLGGCNLAQASLYCFEQ